MREILFRGKRVDNGEWVEGFYFESSLGVQIVRVNGSFLVYPETVGQFTGLLDKNGDRIFEGDFVKVLEGHKSWINIEFEVKFKYGAFYIDENDPNSLGWGCSFATYSDQLIDNGFNEDPSKYIEITGNIHHKKI